jgi:hypothetical protein
MKFRRSPHRHNQNLPTQIIEAFPFIGIIIFLGGWSLGFYAFQSSISTLSSDGLRCITFFGGLLVAILLGALAGTFVKRLAGKKRNKPN